MPSATRSIAVCTLAEGSYHAGTAALANSLHASGFRGPFVVGSRGALPEWSGGRNRLDLPGGMSVQFRDIRPERMLHFEKSDLLLALLDEQPGLDAVTYIDADIIVRAGWRFFEDWSRHGVGLCMDAWPTFVPSGHPWRQSWAATAARMGYPVRPLDYYCNAGFIQVPREHRRLLEIWRDANSALSNDLGGGDWTSEMKFGEVWDPYHRTDQDALAIAMMASDVPLSVLGPDGMSFTGGLQVMTHAVGTPKPWQRRYVREALKGLPPLIADRAYWEHCDGPIEMFAPPTVRTRKRALKIATTLASLFRRPRYWASG